MNLKEYISSGIVESYVMGLAEKEERAEFERMCAEHAEVKAARDTFELLLEKQALENAIQPPAVVKTKVLAEIADARPSTAPLIPITKNNVTGNVSRLRYLVAASVILLIGSTALNFYFFSQYKNYSSKYANLLAANSQLASNNNVINTRLQSYESALAKIKDPAMIVVKMPGTAPHPGSLATVYWHEQSKDVYLLINNMPEPSTDKQYQLWAIVDGKPVDAGVFDTNNPLALVKMKSISNASAFAITLEKRGGSPSPTMSQLYVIGNVKT